MRQRIDPEQAVIRLAAPRVLVFRSIIDEKEQARAGQALYQAVEQRLRLAVDSVEILEQNDQRLGLALANQ